MADVGGNVSVISSSASRVTSGTFANIVHKRWGRDSPKEAPAGFSVGVGD